MDAFEKFRKRDNNLEIAISDQNEILDYYMFSSSFYNTFSKTEMENCKKIESLIDIKKIETQRLEDVLDKYNVNEIDFMTVDVEGFDLSVFKSNNWSKYRPKVIITEFFAKDLDDLKNDSVFIFLKNIGYTQFCNTSTNMFYIENNYLQKRYKK
jgi:FkbM family methyltransferase